MTHTHTVGCLLLLADPHVTSPALLYSRAGASNRLGSSEVEGRAKFRKEANGHRDLPLPFRPQPSHCIPLTGPIKKFVDCPKMTTPRS